MADVPWLLYRAFFALPKSIVDGEGRPVNALLGTVNALLNAAETCGPRAIVACFGAEQARYRVELYPPYHAHRDPMPAELRWQWQQAPALLTSLGWTVSDAGDLEADDAMGSYAHVETRAAGRESDGGPPGARALLLTGDRDMFQAVDDQTAVLELKKGAPPIEVGPAEVRARYGVDPKQVPDFIAIRGDPSDGLPGAPGIGAKTAAELLSKHGSLEAVLAAAEHPDPARRPPKAATLLHHAGQLLLFKQVATLVPIDVERPPDRPTDFAAGAATARELGMKRLAERLAEIATA
ncbi:MAG: 5'-3' exonuclease [Solirubrobacteraceae bacterium]